MLQDSNSTTIQPKVVVIRRRPNQGFGFTLRHFIAYPPEDDPSWPQEASDPYHHQVKAMETIFIKEVQPNGPAHYANLQTGDRVLMVNNTPIAGLAYSTIVSMIKQTPSVLTLHVVPKECDVLQMHYTSIAHTPETNRLATGPRPIPSPVTVGNGNAAGALIPLQPMVGAKAFPAQQQLISAYPAQAVPVALSGKGSRSSSITSTSSGSFRPVVGSEFVDMSSQGLQHHHGRLLIRDDGTFMQRTQPPPNLTVLSRQQQQQQQQHQQHQPQQYQQTSTAFYPPAAAADTSELMIRLRESIKQKEEFLKSPLPHTQQQQHSHQQPYQQHFFPHTPPSGSPQLSMVSTTSTSAGSSVLSTGPRGQVRSTLVKQPLSATSSSASSTRELLPSNAVSVCDMQNYYSKTVSGGNFVTVESMMSRGGADSGNASGGNGAGAVGREVGNGGNGGNGAALHAEASGKPMTFPTMARYARHTPGNNGSNAASNNGSGGIVHDKYARDLDYLETLQETGVTNKVFERKLVSHLAKGFDPFQPLSINTNAIDSAGAPGNVMVLKKPGVLYESLQHHPLHQLQLQQIQQTQVQPHSLPQPQTQMQAQAQLPKVHQVGGTNTNVVDGSQYSRMEIHKATLATTTIDHAPSKYTNKLPEATPEQKPALTDIAENNEVPSVKVGVSDAGIVRRFKPMSSFDDSKPMRRISYLRATNNEADYQSDTSLTATSAPISGADVGISVRPVIEVTTKESIDEDTDPTYDVVAGDERESIETSVDLEEDAKTETAAIETIVAKTPTIVTTTPTATAGTMATASATSESRRDSEVSEIRNSVHIDDVIADINGKLETKDVATEMEVFETEMEIKSSCINGKRLSEYRSWRQVKIEIKGDMLRIYPGRSCKSDSNVIELDIRNFKIFDESIDKKKSYMFRMQSKPTQIATLGNELNLDDMPDKLTSSGSSASTSASHTDQHQYQHHSQPQQQQQQPTEILFKTKSMTEMKRIFGLLQWKNSLIYDDSDLQGRQLAEPQKTVAIASMPTATYCDDNVQQQQQQQQSQQQQSQHQLQPEYSPLSTTSRGEPEVSDSISPVMKTRKSSSHKNIPDKDLGSPKAKNWKDLLFRRGGGSGSHNADISPSNLASAAKTTGSIGVPLRACPMSKDNEYVPLLVDVCTNIVESKGLSIVGIYRIPGNKAAISELSEQVNKSDFSWDRCHTDVRWEDVNVVSSLLKQFIRNLPDALLPCSFYINFIEADKKTGLDRLKELKELLASLPRHSYETLKHLIRHLSRVSKNCHVNLMEPKNLAIIFGPSIIRTPNDTLEIAVKDMKHQCRIVELLVTQYDYFFENGTLPDLADVSGNTPITSISSSSAGVAQSQEDQTNMLLHNVSKIERLTERETKISSTSRFIPQLRRRTHSKRGAASSDTYSGESVLSLDSSKSAMTASGSSTNTTTASSSSSSSANANTIITTTKKKERGFFVHHGGMRSHHRKASLDEKDSGSGSGSGGSMTKEQQRSSVDISVLLTDDDSSNSRSDTGSMSLTTITDTLDSKLRNLRSGSESNDENGSPEFPKNRRHTFGQPLHLHSENIPYADESPERHFHSCPLDAPNVLMLSKSCTATNTIALKGSNEQSSKEQRPTALTAYKSNKLQHSATAPINSTSGVSSTPATAVSTPTAIVTVKTSAIAGSGNAGSDPSVTGAARNAYMSRSTRYSTSVYEQCCSDDDSEGSTTSDPKDSLIIASPSFFLDRYNKKRRDHRLFRSASFNCRNYSTRHGSSCTPSASALTKDEKTDMNLTKKRQIQNKQNRSIKRRHTVGGPHDYVGTGAGGGAGTGTTVNNCNHHCKTGGGGTPGTTTTTTTTVLRRIPIPSANGNISNNNNNINANQQNDGSNGNSGSGGVSSSGSGSNGAATVAVAGAGGEHVLEVGIRIKNINRSRY